MWAEAHSNGTGAVWAEAHSNGTAAIWAEAKHDWTGAVECRRAECRGRPDPDGGGAYHGGPLSSTLDRQVPVRSEQQVEWPTLFVAHLMAIGKWHALSVGWWSIAYSCLQGLGVDYNLEIVLFQSITLVILLSFTARDLPPPTRSTWSLVTKRRWR